jgi:hypothetical protein
MTTLIASPELTLHQSVKFVAGAYAVLLAVILIYVAIMALRLKRNQREIEELQRELLAREAAEAQVERESEPVA